MPIQAYLALDRTVSDGWGKPGYSFRVPGLRAQLLRWNVAAPIQFSCPSCHRRLDSFGFSSLMCQAGHPVDIEVRDSLITVTAFTPVLAAKLEAKYDPLAAMIVASEIADWLETQVMKSDKDPLGGRKNGRRLTFGASLSY